MNRRRNGPVFGCAVLATVLVLAGCTTSRQTRGYIVDEALMSAIAPGVDNRASVQGTLGSPSTTSAFGEEVWYYISRLTVTKGFLQEQAQTQTIVEIQFDDGGTVSNVRRYDLADAQDIAPRADITPVRGKTLGFFQQIFSGIGRVGPGGPGGPGGAGGPGR